MTRGRACAIRALAASAAVVLAAGAGGCAGRECGVAYAEPVSTCPTVDLSAKGSVRAGSTSGFIQIPKGGQPGTTSPRRPTLEEMGVNSAIQPSVDLSLRWGRHEIHAGATDLFLSGDGRLQDPLVTHEDSYPVGTDLTSDSSILQGSLGYRYGFLLPAGRGSLRLAPGVAIHGVALDYKVSGSNGVSSTRAFSSWSPAIEVGFDWRPGGRARVTGDVSAVLDEALGSSSPTTEIQADVQFHLDLSDHASLFLETGVMHVEHHDAQTVPNHYEIDFAPWIGLGGELRF